MDKEIIIFTHTLYVMACCTWVDTPFFVNAHE